jgi:hypothetical protein
VSRDQKLNCPGALLGPPPRLDVAREVVEDGLPAIALLLEGVGLLGVEEKAPPGRRSTVARGVCQSSEAAFHLVMSSGVV